jgi:hypothetical protein
MHGLTIREHDYPQPSSAGLVYSSPASYSAIGLNLFMLRVFDYPGNPGVAYSSAIASPPDHPEVFGCFHSPKAQRPVCPADD